MANMAETMKIKSVAFIQSITRLADVPGQSIPEVAFIGRSNVGKSSLINMLLGRKKLAKISATPGKTQTINYFLINGSWHAVDLPGYGWAKVSRTKKLAWSGFVREYLLDNPRLACLFVLIDIRLEPQPNDLEFLYWAAEKQIPLALVFTKADKSKKNQQIRSVELFKKTLLPDWAFLPEIFISSAVTKTGREEILDFIGSII